MIAALVRRDPAIRPTLLLAVPIPLLVAFQASLLGPSDGVLILLVPLLLPWVGGSSTVRPRLHGTELGLALPVVGRTLAAVRMTALAIWALVPPAITLPMVAIAAPGLAGPAARTGANLGGAVLFWVLLVQSLYPGCSEVPAGAPLTGANLAGIAAIAVALASPNVAPAMVFAALSVVLVVRTWRSVPPTLELAAPQRDRQPGYRPWGGLDGLLLSHIDWGSLSSVSLMIPLVLANRQGEAPSFIEVASLPFWFALLVLPKDTWSTISWLDPLPLPRWRLFAYVAVPPLFAMVVSLLAGEAMLSKSRPRPLVDFQFDCLRTLDDPSGDVCHYQVKVPAEDWRLALWGGTSLDFVAFG